MGILDSLLGRSSADAANRAAADTYAKQRAGIDDLKAYAGTVPGRFDEVARGYQPYINAGGDALQRLMLGLGLGGGNGSEFTNAYRAIPGYEAGRSAGLNATERTLNAGNMGQSGRAMKALYRYGSDYEDQRSNDYFNRLSGVVTGGQAATGAAAGLRGQGLSTEAGLRQSAFGGDMNAAGTIGQGMVAGAQAEQNALTNLMGMGAYLGGSFLGGGAKMPSMPSFAPSWFGTSGRF